MWLGEAGSSLLQPSVAEGEQHRELERGKTEPATLYHYAESERWSLMMGRRLAVAADVVELGKIMRLGARPS